MACGIRQERLRDGRALEADFCVCTLPLGVLKRDPRCELEGVLEGSCGFRALCTSRADTGVPSKVKGAVFHSVALGPPRAYQDPCNYCPRNPRVHLGHPENNWYCEDPFDGPLGFLKLSGFRLQGRRGHWGLRNRVQGFCSVLFCATVMRSTWKATKIPSDAQTE